MYGMCHSKNKILGKTAANSICGIPEIKTNVPKVTLDQVDPWNVQLRRKYGIGQRTLVFTTNL